jgi:hypothetical protein
MTTLDGSDEYMSATVSVPKHRFAEFHTMFGRWLAQEQGTADGPAFEPPSGSAVGGEALRWKETDAPEAIIFLESLSDKALAIIDLWLDAPEGEWTSAEASAAATGLDGAYGVAGSLSSVGRAMKKVNRVRPFEHKAGEVAYYRISEPVRSLFLGARSEMR